jgi:hypothetical protein
MDLNISQESEKYKEFRSYLEGEKIEEMKLMLEEGFEINEHYYDIEGREEARILFLTKRGSNKIFKFILENGADPNFLLEEGNDRSSILQELVNMWKNKYKIEIILKYGANPEGSSEVTTPLEHCVKYNKRKYIEILLRFGADPEKIKDEGVREKFYEMFSTDIKPAKR